MPESTDNFFDDLNDLGAIERKLTEELKDAEIIGSLPITEEDLKKLTHLMIRDHIHPENLAQVTEKFRRNFSHCLAVFMVFIGIYKYERGDYWGPLSQCLQITKRNCRQIWGPFFLEFLEEHDFPQFQKIKGHKYVAPILAHGGIPNYCLNDFFARLLWPAVDEMWGSYAQEVLADWDNHPSLKVFTDKPVRRFLQHGGKVAMDFLERCLEMANRTKENNQVPDAQEVGLPKRIVDEWRKWFREQRLVNSQQSRGMHSQFRKPSITFNPYDSKGVILNLPERPLRTDTNFAHWLIKADEEETTVPVNLFPHDSSYIKTGEKDSPLSPAHQYHVQLFSDSDELVQQWPIKGVSDDQPALVFNPYNGKLLDIVKLSKRLVWFVYPKDAQLSSADGIELPSLPEAWRDFQACEVALETPVTLLHQGREHIFAYEDPNAHLHFADGVLVQETDEGEEGIPLYSELPTLVIPKQHFSTKGKLVIIPQGVTHLATYKEIRGQELMRIATGNPYEFPLSDERLLGEKAVGKFLLKWRWQGHDAKLYLWVVPHLKIDCPELLVGFQHAKITIFTNGNTELELGTEGIKVDLSSETNIRIYEFSVPSSCIEIKGFLKYELDNGVCEIPLEIQIPHLKWGIMGLIGQRSIDWQENLLHLNLAELEQADDPCLLVKTTYPVQGLEFQMLLLRGTEQTPMEPCKPKGGHIPRFHLRQFLQNTIATTQLGKYRVALKLSRPGNRQEEIPVLQILRALNISNLAVRSKKESDGLRLSIAWHGGNQIEGLILRLWNLWKPWQEPLIINDIDNRNSVELERPPSELSPGYYRVQFDVEDPWVQSEIDCPSQGDPNIFDQRIGPELWETHLSTLSGVSGTLEHFFAWRISKTHTEFSQNRITEITFDEIQQVLEQARLVQEEYGEEGLHAFFNHLKKCLSLVAFFSAVLKKPKLATEALLRFLVGLGVAQDSETRLWFLQQAEILDDITRQMFWEWWAPFGLWTELPLEGLNHTRLMRNIERYLELEFDEDPMLWQISWRSAYRNQWRRVNFHGDEVWCTSGYKKANKFYHTVKQAIPLPKAFVKDMDSWCRESERVYQMAFTIDIIVLAQRLMARCFHEEDWNNPGFQVFEAFPELYRFELCSIEMEYRVFKDFSNDKDFPNINFKAQQLFQGSSDAFHEADVTVTDIGILVNNPRQFSDPQFFSFNQLQRYTYHPYDFLMDMWCYFGDEVLVLKRIDSQIKPTLHQHLECMMPNLIIEKI